MKCGSASPGPTCQWENNYTECGPCYSLNTCPLCLRKYRPDELVIQCRHCLRWCHSMCANIFTEEMAERKCEEQSFLCLLCQPNQTTLTCIRYASSNSFLDQPILPNKPLKCEEGVYLTDVGTAQLKSMRPKLATQSSRKSKQVPPKNTNGSLKRLDSNLTNDDERSDDEKSNEQQGKRISIKKYTGRYCSCLS